LPLDRFVDFGIQLQKIETLEEKINAEQEQLDQKIEQMIAEILVFDDLDELQDNADLTKAYLLQMKERYIKRRDVMKSRVKAISAEYEKSKQ